MFRKDKISAYELNILKNFHVHELRLDKHLNLTKKLQELSELLKTSDTALRIVCLDESDSLLNSVDIYECMQAISACYSSCNRASNDRLILKNPENLSQFNIYKLLNDANFVNMISPVSFKKILAVSEDTATFILNLEHLRAKLNSIDEDENTQTLKYSCAARSLMMAMYEMGQLTESNCTRSTELEIYLQICDEYGKPARPDKITDYLKKQHIDVCGVEISESINDFYRYYSFNVNPSHCTLGTNPLLRAHALFKSYTPNIKKISMSDEASFPENTLALMITRNSSETGTGSHTVFCKKSAGKYKVINPSFGTEKEFNNLKDLMTSMGGLGIFYFVSLQHSPELVTKQTI